MGTGDYDEFRRRNDELNRENEERHRRDAAETQRRLEREQDRRERAERFDSITAPVVSTGSYRGIAWGVGILVIGVGLGLAVASRFLVTRGPTGQSSKPAIHEVDSPAQASSVIAKTERALVDQVACREPPQAGSAISAMLRNHLVKPTDDGGDGSVVFVPVKPLRFLGFPLVRITGWQENPNGGAMPPFFRGPGTAPPNFISIVVDARPAEIRSAIRRKGMREGRYLGAPAEGLLPGVDIHDGDSDFVESPKQGVSTLTCTANEYDFEQ